MKELINEIKQEIQFIKEKTEMSIKDLIQGLGGIIIVLIALIAFGQISAPTIVAASEIPSSSFFIPNSESTSTGEALGIDDIISTEIVESKIGLLTLVEEITSFICGGKAITLTIFDQYGQALFVQRSY